MEPKDEIREKCDLKELIGEYIPLKPAGSDSYKGLCPFHGEKTPSFHVSPDKQIWHCFGCAEGGDCFSFVMRMEGMTFPEALMHLGAKTGVEIRRVPGVENNLRQRMLEINDFSQRFYTKVLKESTSAAVARGYVLQRGIDDDLVERFGLGFAPDEWDTLSVVLAKRGYSESEMVEAGMSMKKKDGRGVIDRFRNRLMIPLRDHHGNTVGFTGRKMPGDDHGPKYMNSPETPVYKKSEIVFGLDLAKRPARTAGALIITEGNLDVVASHKAGVEHIVASSGTALTSAQLTLMKRYAESIIFAFDRDAAGFDAAKKGIILARELGLDVRATILPEDVKDPDELVQKDPELWRELASASVPIMEFLIAYTTRGKDLRQIDDKRAVAKELLPAISQMQTVVEREHWLQVVADLLSIDIHELRKAIEHKKVEETTKKDPVKKDVLVKISKLDQARRLLFGWAIGKETEFPLISERLKIVLGEDDLWMTLYNMAVSTYDSTSQPAQKSFFSRIREALDGHPMQESLEALLDSSTLMAEQIFHNLSPQKVLEHIEILFHLLEESTLKQGREKLARDLRLAEQTGDTAAVARLLENLRGSS
ncbi:MAG: DNA primase [Parcubacteria group bacterium]|nr:DNA primase [Parcubacteria group bacterium]